MRNLFAFFALSFSLIACAPEATAPWRATPEGSGPRVKWDLEVTPLPDVPLPNDIATWPDPTTTTGLRLNASTVAPTAFERNMRAHLDELDGWGTSAPISVAFDKPLDVAALLERQGRDRLHAYDFREHAIYVVDLTTGLPVPLDFESGATPLGLAEPNRYGANDPRGGGENLIFETVDEDSNGNGKIDVGEDTDFDGVLDAPNTLTGRLSDAPNAAYDEVLSSWERESNTLIIRPMLPLEEARTYAVVLTDRLVGADGRPVRSPFDGVHHDAQRTALSPLAAQFASHADLYGDLSTRGWQGVAFAWTFTTQSVSQELRAIREGLYGRGVLASLAEDHPATLVAVQAQDDSPACAGRPELGRPYIATSAQVKEVARVVAGAAFGLSEQAVQALVDSFDYVDHFVLVFVKSPYFVGDPNMPSLEDSFDVDLLRGRARTVSVDVPVLITVPRERPGATQPFPVSYYVHSYSGTHLEALGFAGTLARQGIATVAPVLPGHGLGVADAYATLLRGFFGGNCLNNFGNALVIDRALDWNGDGVIDSGAEFWTGYAFHTRDMIRQSAIDIMQITRALKGFDGVALANGGDIAATRRGFSSVQGDGDFNHDGAPDIAGDFDGDGRVDVGGPLVPYFAWGQSLGAIVAATTGGVEPSLTGVVSTSGAGGLAQTSARSSESSVRNAVIMRLLGPLVTTEPTSNLMNKTACDATSLSLRFAGTVGNDFKSVEIGCIPQAELTENSVLLVANLTNHELACGRVDAQSLSRVALAADDGDALQVELYANAVDKIDPTTCTWRDGLHHEAVRVVSEWQSGVGACEECGMFAGRTLQTGELLRALSSGLGLRRQSPEFRRLLGFAQIALEPADPINYARRYFLSPFEGTPLRSFVPMVSLGDSLVPVAGAHQLARAAGILAFMPHDAPAEFNDFAAPADFASRYDGASSPSDVLIDHYVTEGLASRERVPTSFARDWLLDPDVLSDGQQRFVDRNGGQPATSSEGYVPPSLLPPLRWVRASRASRGPADNPFVVTAADGVSAIPHFMVKPSGEHGADPADPRKLWDEGVYVANLVGWYFASNAQQLLYVTSPSTHQCLENESCVFGQSP